MHDYKTAVANNDLDTQALELKLRRFSEHLSRCATGGGAGGAIMM